MAPITSCDDELIAVVALYRFDEDNMFTEAESEIIKAYLVCATIALHYSNLCIDLRNQEDLNQFMLSVVK